MQAKTILGYKPEFVEKRQTGGHCDMHQENTLTLSQNTVDLASIKAQSKLLTILLPLIFSLASIVVGYFSAQMNKTMDKLADNMAVVQSTVHASQITAATNAQKLENIEWQIEEIKAARSHK